MTGQCTAPKHGTLTAYNTHRCRCDTARAAHARDEVRRRLDALRGITRLVDATGTHRRLRALMAIGWRARDIAPRIGWPSGELDTIFRRSSVHRDTAARVTAVYDELADTPGPSDQTRRRAVRAGWLAPLWWDDDVIDDPAHTPPVRSHFTKHDIDPVAVERACAGQPPLYLTVAERREVVAGLAGRGYSDGEIADVLGTSRDAVTKHRQRHGISAAVPSGRAEAS